MTEFPVTTATASVLALMFVVLSVRTAMLRGTSNVGLGSKEPTDPIELGKEHTAPPLMLAIRRHGNFAEYVPLALIMMALLESAHANHLFLVIIGSALIFARFMHAFGLGRAAPNPYRAAGAGLTFLLLATMAIYGLRLTIV